MLHKVKVFNLESPRTSKPVANQFIIETQEGRYFQSYSSIIAYIPSENHKIANGIPYKIVLDPEFWNYSKTTSKYRSIFLGESTKETQEKINNGTYITRSLN